MRLDRPRYFLLASQVLLLLSLLTKHVFGSPLCWVFFGVGITALIVAVCLQLGKRTARRAH